MEKKHVPYGPYEKYFKRPIDFCCGLAAVIVFSWLYLILIVLGAIFMRGNPFFTQDRPGKDEKVFKLIKFRTMDNRRDKDGNLLPDEVRLNKYPRVESAVCRRQAVLLLRGASRAAPGWPRAGCRLQGSVPQDHPHRSW